MERTEEQKLVQEPVKIILGGEEYEIKPLAIKYSSPWCSKVVALFKSLPQYAKVTTDTPTEFGEALMALMVGKPSEIVDLFFAYARDLNREEIEEIATSAEIMDGFEKVMSLERPFFGAVNRLATEIARQ